MAVFLLRYGELGIKSARIRRKFERKLISNLARLLEARGATGEIEREWGRLRLRSEDESRAIDALCRCFGLVSFSPVVELSSELETLAREVPTLARSLLRTRDRFALRVRRNGEHPYTSADAARVLGDAVRSQLADLDLRVDLSHPDRTLYLEIRSERAYLHTEILPGPGGLPVGCQGRVVALVDGARGALAAWYAMRRGCAVVCLVSGRGDEWVDTLTSYAPDLETVRATADAPMPEARALAQTVHAAAIVRGASIAAALEPLDPGVPVLDPLVGLLDSEIEERLRRIRDPLGPERALGRAIVAAGGV